MMERKKDLLDNSELRQLAEKKLDADGSNTELLSGMSPENMTTLIHELQVHQIELKMQNDELRRIYEELEQSRDKYSHLYDFAPIGYLTVTEKGIIDEVNLTLASMLGTTRTDLLGKPFHRFVLKEDQDLFYKHRQRLLETGTPQSCELSLVKKGGDTFYARLECLVIKKKEHDLRQIRVSVSDITEIKEISRALQESETKYRSMMDSMKDAAYICSSDFRIEYSNPAMIKRIGRDAFGEICHKAIYGMDEKCSWCTMDKIGELKCIEYEMADPRTGHAYLVSNSPITHPDGEISNLTVFRDISEIKIIEENLRQSQKMESIGTLAGGIAHDFNNILGIIIGNTELAMEDVPKWNPSYDNLEEIKTAGLRAKNIVRQILSFSRKSDQSLQPIEIASVIKDSLKFLRSTIPTTIEIQQVILTQGEMILADPTQINQIMMNLCINASHAMEQTGGILTVNVENIILDDTSTKDYPGLSSGQHVKIMVKDTGPGISPEIIKRIFDPYFTTKELGKGSGMGLAVVQGIVQNHNGAIQVESKPGKGAVFSALFPVVENRSKIVVETTEDSFHGTETILFVDDEAPIVKLCMRMLEGLGYKVETEMNPARALDLFKSKPDRFDLVITDMTMPQMTGVKFAEEIMKIRSDIPVIICTGYSSLINEERAKLLGIAAYVMKPIMKTEMSKTIRKVLAVAKSKI